MAGQAASGMIDKTLKGCVIPIRGLQRGNLQSGKRRKERKKSRRLGSKRLGAEDRTGRPLVRGVS